jgi:hypothetical protein
MMALIVRTRRQRTKLGAHRVQARTASNRLWLRNEGDLHDPLRLLARRDQKSRLIELRRTTVAKRNGPLPSD